MARMAPPIARRPSTPLDERTLEWTGVTHLQRFVARVSLARRLLTVLARALLGDRVSRAAVQRIVARRRQAITLHHLQ